MSDKVEVTNRGAGLITYLTIIFVIAKLAGIIKWSWWIVFLPVIISYSLLIALILFAMAIAGLAFYVENK